MKIVPWPQIAANDPMYPSRAVWVQMDRMPWRIILDPAADAAPHAVPENPHD